MSTIAVSQVIKKLKSNVTAADIATIAGMMSIEIVGSGSRQRIDAQGAERIINLESERRPEETLVETAQRTQRQSENRQVQNRIQSDVPTEESQQGLDYFGQKVVNDSNITGRQMAAAFAIRTLEVYEEQIGNIMYDPELSAVITDVANKSTRKFQNLFIREENGFRDFLLPTSAKAPSENLLPPAPSED